MTNPGVVAVKIAAMFLVVLVGYAGRRRGRVEAITTRLLGAFTADVCLPALTFGQLFATVDARSLRQGWMIPWVGAGVILLGQWVGALSVRLFAGERQRRTFVFLTAMANWIYLPLPIVQTLYGKAGVEVLLLMNVGAQGVLWTVGINILQGSGLSVSRLVPLVKNPGLLATAAGIGAALTLPRGVTGPWSQGGTALLEAITLLGSLTVPLSLLVTGAQLGALPVLSRPSRAVLGVLLARLGLTPLAVLGLVLLAVRLGVALSPLAVSVTVLVASMPVAVSCSILTERYGGDTGLSAQSIFASTALSVVTVPGVFWILQRLLP